MAESLRIQGRFDESISEYKKAIKKKPNDGHAHNNLGECLRSQGNINAAITQHQIALGIDPYIAEGHFNLGTDFLRVQKYSEAIAAFRSALDLKPGLVEPHISLANIFRVQDKLEDSLAELRQAIHLNPRFAPAHYNLAKILGELNQHDDAISEYLEAIRLQFDFAAAHCSLGLLLRRLGRYEEALEPLRKGHHLGSKRADWRYPSLDWLQECEGMAALASHLPAVLNGTEKPKGDEEKLAFARVCYDKALYAASARLWSEAIGADSKLADDLKGAESLRRSLRVRRWPDAVRGRTVRSQPKSAKTVSSFSTGMASG